MDSDMTPMADWPYSLKKQTLKRHWLTDTQAPTHLLSLLSMQSEASSCHFLSLCIHQGSCSSNTYIPQGLAGHLFQSESLHHKWRDKHWTWHKESDCVGNLDSLEPNSSQEQTKTQSKAKSQVCAGVGWECVGVQPIAGNGTYRSVVLGIFHKGTNPRCSRSGFSQKGCLGHLGLIAAHPPSATLCCYHSCVPWQRAEGKVIGKPVNASNWRRLSMKVKLSKMTLPLWI